MTIANSTESSPESNKQTELSWVERQIKKLSGTATTDANLFVATGTNNSQPEAPGSQQGKQTKQQQKTPKAAGNNKKKNKKRKKNKQSDNTTQLRSADHPLSLHTAPSANSHCALFSCATTSYKPLRDESPSCWQRFNGSAFAEDSTIVTIEGLLQTGSGIAGGIAILAMLGIISNGLIPGIIAAGLFALLTLKIGIRLLQDRDTFWTFCAEFWAETGKSLIRSSIIALATVLTGFFLAHTAALAVVHEAMDAYFIAATIEATAIAFSALAGIIASVVTGLLIQPVSICCSKLSAHP